MNLKNLRKNVCRSIAVFSAITLMGAAGCTFNITPQDVSLKDDDTQNHAQINGSSEDENNDHSNIDENGSTDTPDNGSSDDENVNNNGGENDGKENSAVEKNVENGKDNCGFTITNPGSFADRVQGVYKIVTDDDEIDEYVEFYNIGDNLYAYYTGYGLGAMEFFANDAEGFASKTKDSMEVKVVSFSIMSNMSSYFSKGLPAIMDMTITDDGIKFSNYMKGSGEMLIPVNAKLERVDQELGYLDGFAYRDGQYDVKEYCKDCEIELTDTPDEILGSWILLGDIDVGFIFEFTEEGYVQAYLKNTNQTVSLYRGTYAVGKEKINGGTNIYLELEAFGLGGSPLFYNMCYVLEEGNLSLVSGDSSFGDDIAWEGALFIPFDMNDIPRQNHDEEALANQFSSYFGTYYADDGHVLILSEGYEDGGYFYLYDAVDPEERTEFYEGYFTETPGSLELFQIDYKDGGDKKIGFVSLLDTDTISLSLESLKNSIEMIRY